jgi:outer membrane protein
MSAGKSKRFIWQVGGLSLLAAVFALNSANAKLHTAKTPAAKPSSAPEPVASFLPPSEETPVEQPVELPDLTLDKDGGITLTLQDSIQLAIRGAASVLKARNDVEITGAQLLQGYGQFLPNFGAQGSYAYSNGTTYLTQGIPTTVQGSNYGATYILSSDLNIFNGLADFSNLRSNILKKDAADLTLFRAKQQIALDIEQAFLQVILDNKLVDIARKNLQESQAREDLLVEQTRVGIRNLSDLFRQQAETSSDESLLLNSENKTRTDQILFLRRLRADVAKKYHFVEPDISPRAPDVRYSDESKLMKTALDNRTDLKASDNLASAAHWDVKTNFAGYLPKLDLLGTMTGGGHYLNTQNVNGTSVTPTLQSSIGYQLGTQIDYTVSLNLTWTLFDRFITHENVVHARATADDADIDAVDRRNQVEGDVRQAFGNYQTAIQQLRASKKGLNAAEKAYEVMEGRYEVGSANFVDLLTVQSALVQAESARAQALIDFLLEGASIDFATGEIIVD